MTSNSRRSFLLTCAMISGGLIAATARADEKEGDEARKIPESWWADAFPHLPHPGRPFIIDSPFGQCWRSSHHRIVTFLQAPYEQFITGQLPPEKLSEIADAVWDSNDPPEVF